MELPPVDFNHPPREYREYRIRGWPLLVERQLEEDAPELAKAAMARLDEKLRMAIERLPAQSLPDLRRVKLFLMYGTRATGGGRDNGLEYHQSIAPRYNPQLDPRMASSIVIYNAENFVQLSDYWALKALVHELGHAQHLEHWPELRADIYDTWKDAMLAGRFQEVRDEDKDVYLPNYAAQNHLEYFAELTAMYFVGTPYYPYDRGGLKRYDPKGYALVRKLWNLHDAPPAKPLAAAGADGPGD